MTEQHVDRNPFVRRQRSRGRSYLYTERGGQELVTESSSPVPVKFLTVGNYIELRDTGLLGRRPSGGTDPSWRRPGAAEVERWRPRGLNASAMKTA